MLQKRREGGKPSITTTGIDETDDIRDGLEMKIGRALYYICSAAAVYYKSRNIRQSEICSRNLHLMFDRPWKDMNFYEPEMGERPVITEFPRIISLLGLIEAQLCMNPQNEGLG